ncbi:hypothetical protein AJ80_00751 [Polytolypa hystricis UAMH7299]|uniref:GH16 domain-containing protein n=1 Tax=Polytolypa hystricis (strain UAMH7299) TaxID=1447883 RepID=A0A2B7Z282_POLH7|nr:hypothetical protein AJ80_00751 [Polytolypa hystricis UAMH7299]
MLLFNTFLLAILATTAESKIDTSCTAFQSRGLAKSIWQYYRFYDFRNIGRSGSYNEPTVDSKTARIVTDRSWTDDWYLRDYPRKSPAPPIIPVDFIPERVNITNSTDDSRDYSTFLTLSSARIDDETQEGGEITFKEFNVTAASIRVYARVHGIRGACAGIFTYLNDTQESDIEIFTKDPQNIIHYSNQPASTGEPDWTPIPGATVNRTMPDDTKWTDWHMHRLDWIPDRSVFFVNGHQINTTTLHVPVASPPSGIYIDMWGSNSSWVGEMPIGGEAWFDIQWIELLFNASTPSPRAKDREQKLCTPDSDMEVSLGVGLASMKDSWMLTLFSFILTVFIWY